MKINNGQRPGARVSVITDKLGHRKSLLLSRLSEDVRNDAIENGIPTESGGRKPVTNATQQEIAAYQKQLREAEQRAQQAEAQAKTAQRSEEFT